MLFVGLAKPRAGTSRERTEKRIDYSYPDGMHVLEEYWLQGEDPEVILVFEADTIEPMMRVISEWDDYFEMRCFPAVDAKTGIEMAKHMMVVAA